jgi:hypothetical protein
VGAAVAVRVIRAAVPDRVAAAAAVADRMTRAAGRHRMRLGDP